MSQLGFICLTENKTGEYHEVPFNFYRSDDDSVKAILKTGRYAAHEAISELLPNTEHDDECAYVISHVRMDCGRLIKISKGKK